MLAEAAESVATPQIRNVGDAGRQRLPAPVVLVLPQRIPVPQERRHDLLLGRRRERSSTRSSAADRATSCIRPTRRRRWSRSTRRSASSGPAGERTVPAADFFALPTVDAARENVLSDGEVLAAIALPAPRAGTRSTYHKVLDREAWTHAVVSAAVVLEMDDGRLPQRAHRARRRRADSVAAAGGREAAGRSAHHAGAGGEGRRSGGRRRAAAREERLQGAADARAWSARTIVDIADRGSRSAD